MAHWIRLGLLCRCKGTRKPQVWYGNVRKQYLLLCKNKRVYCVYTGIVSTKDVPRHTKKKLKNLPQITRFLCMHKILVHAQQCCACKRILCMHKNLDKQTPVARQVCGLRRFLFRKKASSKQNNVYLKEN